MQPKTWLRGEYTSRIAAVKRSSVQSLERLEGERRQRETAYGAHPDWDNYEGLATGLA